MVHVEIAKLHDAAKTPSYARSDDAGVDLVTIDDATLAAGGGRALLRTGIAVAIPPGYAGFVLPRSGLAAKHGVTVTNAPGLIDAGYRGEILVTLINTDPANAYQVRQGDRIAQLVVQQVAHVECIEVVELKQHEAENARNAGGFGHSGAN